MRWCLPYALCDESLQASYGTVPTYSALACQVRRHRAERYYTPRRRQFLPPGLLRPDLDVEYCTQSRRGQTAYNVRPFQELTGNRSQFSSCSTRNASGTAYCDATGTHQPRPTLSTAQGKFVSSRSRHYSYPLMNTLGPYEPRNPIRAWSSRPSTESGMRPCFQNQQSISSQPLKKLSHLAPSKSDPFR
ncbi:uncharacterized protein CC84DRAFT_715477 [Paraphaeosphaeria sporulosa]|uniref:Uncharacterized protein n=1 Tax=Paraphaeosphaeria sporulosa TaxID=1460663 RepID=A0A177CKC0_9PLEO|nr:uncharacterized protein CC84DRAFT_715477 [Paraphaeosphaeria sporulosa]OAG07756.1 hypothetical protein CC84DRAFT_715477 [Paraphaeosphaeria sporulosa]